MCEAKCEVQTGVLGLPEIWSRHILP